MPREPLNESFLLGQQLGSMKAAGTGGGKVCFRPPLLHIPPPFTLTNFPSSVGCILSHFLDEETEAQRLEYLSEGGREGASGGIV